MHNRYIGMPYWETWVRVVGFYFHHSSILFLLFLIIFPTLSFSIQCTWMWLSGFCICCHKGHRCSWYHYKSRTWIFICSPCQQKQTSTARGSIHILYKAISASVLKRDFWGAKVLNVLLQCIKLKQCIISYPSECVSDSVRIQRKMQWIYLACGRSWIVYVKLYLGF